jgi:hypothetical protein
MLVVVATPVGHLGVVGHPLWLWGGWATPEGQLQEKN